MCDRAPYREPRAAPPDGQVVPGANYRKIRSDRDGIDGILFTSSDSEELACAIGRLIGNPELRRQMAKSCRERITEKYDLGKNILHLSKVFSRWISHNDAASPVSH